MVRRVVQLVCLRASLNMDNSAQPKEACANGAEARVEPRATHG